VILTVFALILLLLWRMWVQFRERTIDPLVEDAGEAWDAVDSKADALADGAMSRARDAKGWIKGLFGR